ncbi:MAG: EamA family transporter, partial [Fimbriimonadaceae bacterium]|nr:EamA family transporter [Alphaproteobacteria bacterium]
IAGLVVAMIGVAIIAGEPKLDGNGWAVLLVLGGGFTWALGQIMIRQLGQIGGFVLITWVAVIATPQMFLASWIFETGQWEAIANAGKEVWIAILYMGLIMTAFGYAIWYRLLGLYPVNNVAPFLLLLPIVVTIESVLFLGESLTWMISLGGLLTISGVALLVISERPPATVKQEL